MIEGAHFRSVNIDSYIFPINNSYNTCTITMQVMKKKKKTNVKLHVILKYALKHYYKTKS